MISSLNNAIICGILLAANPVFAQDTPPDSMPPEQPAEAAPRAKMTFSAPHETISVSPAASAPDSAAPVPALPASQAVPAQQAEPAPLSSAAMPAPTIGVAPVSAPPIEGIGTLDDAGGGLGANVWQGSTNTSAEPLLTWVHAGVSHPALRNLTERLLLTRATPPAGTDANWLTERVEALVAMGSDDKAEQLIAAVPDSMMTDALLRLQVQILLLQGDSAGACKIGEKNAVAAANGTEITLWQKLNVYCKAAGGHIDEAMLALDLLRETNATDDAFLQDIVHKLTDKKYALKAMPQHWSLFDVALIRIVGESEKLKDRLDYLPPVTFKYLAADTTLEPKFRDKAEKTAIQLGIIPPKDAGKAPPPQLAFSRNLAGDVTALVASLGAGNPASMESDNAIISRLVLDDTAAVQDCRRVQRLLTLMEPFGYRIAPEVWNKLFLRRGRIDAESPPAILIDRISEAAAAGKKGEVVMLAALIINSADVDKLHELILLPVVKALNKVGFTKEARELAHDAVQSYSTH